MITNGASKRKKKVKTMEIIMKVSYSVMQIITVSIEYQITKIIKTLPIYKIQR